MSLESRLTSLLLNPAYHDYLAILKGARNGLVYGIKVRFPHALVMSILFGRGTPAQRANSIYKATKQHALNLAKFVTIYKTTLLFLKKVHASTSSSSSSSPKEPPPHSIDTFLAGLLGGYIVFGSRNAVNEQIVLYVFSRVFTTLLPRSEPAAGKTPVKGKPRAINEVVFQVYAAVTWGAVMWLFREERERLQAGMSNSMQYLYLDSESWTNWRTLLWHNK